MTIWLRFIAYLNPVLRNLIKKYGWNVVKQLAIVGLTYAKNKQGLKTEEERHDELARLLRAADLVPGTSVDDDAIEALVVYFLGPRKS
jgi:hypothetical protein